MTKRELGILRKSAKILLSDREMARKHADALWDVAHMAILRYVRAYFSSIGVKREMVCFYGKSLVKYKGAGGVWIYFYRYNPKSKKFDIWSSVKWENVTKFKEKS